MSDRAMKRPRETTPEELEAILADPEREQFVRQADRRWAEDKNRFGSPAPAEWHRHYLIQMLDRERAAAPAVPSLTVEAVERLRRAYRRVHSSYDGECEHGFGPPATKCPNVDCDDRELALAWAALLAALATPEGTEP